MSSHLHLQNFVQMRVEPSLCDSAVRHKNPIFNKTTCQLSYIMNPSSPRCQISYLRWICDRARMPIADSRPNHFTLPEADHFNAYLPPVPYLATARDAFVSLCGQVVTRCGLLHTTANCQAPGYKDHALNFRQMCANPRQHRQVERVHH